MPSRAYLALFTATFLMFPHFAAATPLEYFFRAEEVNEKDEILEGGWRIRGSILYDPIANFIENPTGILGIVSRRYDSGMQIQFVLSGTFRDEREENIRYIYEEIESFAVPFLHTRFNQIDSEYGTANTYIISTSAFTVIPSGLAPVSLYIFASSLKGDSAVGAGLPTNLDNQFGDYRMHFYAQEQSSFRRKLNVTYFGEDALTSTVPLPASAVLISAALATLCVWRRKRTVYRCRSTTQSFENGICD